MKKIALSLFLLSSFAFADNHEAGQAAAKTGEVKAPATPTPAKKPVAAAKKKDHKASPAATTGEKAEAKPGEVKN